MGGKKTGGGVENVYAAAQKWVDCALRSDDSLFTPGTPIWTRQWLGELRKRFLDRPDEGEGNFYQKLEQQLAGSPPEVYQLMAEVLYVHYLIIWHQRMKGDTKLDRIVAVLERSNQHIKIPVHLVAGLIPGIAGLGAGAAHIRNYLGFLIEFVESWKNRESSECDRMLKDPWEFKDFAALPDGKTNAQREALLHLVFPDTFEGLVSVSDKRKIASAFDHLVKEPTDDVDCKLMQIRKGVEAALDRNFRLLIAL